MPLEQDQCHYVYFVDGEGSPSDWLPYLDGDPGGDVVTNTATLNWDVSYIRSDGANSEQWFTVQDTGGAPTTDAIRRVVVEAYVKSDDFFIGSCRLTLGIGADTIGGGDHSVFPQWTRITESFDLTPDATPTQFVWADIDNIDIGITNLTVGGEIRCTRMSIWVDTCAYTACPRCCCCCLCFAPILRIPAGAFTYELGDNDLICPDLVLTLPFCDYYFLGGCWFVHGGSLNDCGADYDPIPVGDQVVSTLDGHTYELRLVGATMVGNVLSAEGCARIQIQFLVYDVTSSSILNVVTIGETVMTLDQCEPYHESHIDMADVDITPALPVSGTIYLDCSEDNAGELPIPP